MTEISQNHAKLLDSVVRMNVKFVALALGLIMGLTFFLITNWLLIKGGHISSAGEYVVGPHLQLLSQVFIGYQVSFLGSIIGFFYGFAIGTLAGSAVGLLYNKIVDIRN